MDRGVWQAVVHGVTKNQPQLSTHTVPPLLQYGDKFFGLCGIALFTFETMLLLLLSRFSRVRLCATP